MSKPDPSSFSTRKASFSTTRQIAPEAKLSDLSRLFYAVWPDAVTASQLAVRQARLDGKKSAAADFHLTLAFLGNQPSSLLPIFDQIGAALPLPECPLVFDRYGVFSRQGVVWAGLSSVPDSLINLQQALQNALKQQGIHIAHAEHFIPHITLARRAQPPADLRFAPIVCKHYRLVLAGSKKEAGHQFGSSESRYHVIRHYGTVHLD